MSRRHPDDRLATHAPTGWVVDPLVGHVYSPHVHPGALERIHGSVSHRGYLVAARSTPRRWWQLKVIVWEAAHSEAVPDGKMVRPINGDERDLRIANLELADAHPRALTNEQVLDIYRTSGETTDGEAARKYGVSRTLVNKIRRGRKHQDVTGASA